MKSMNTPYQCIIIGGGPAALQAALFLGRASVGTYVIGIPEKSGLAYGKVIGNYFGLPDDPTGKILLDNGAAQIGKYGIGITKEEVIDVGQLENRLFRVVTETKKEFVAQTFLIATGQAYTRAGFRNEEKFLGRGVHTCVACDGIFYKGKKVAVIGSGPHAAEEAIELTTYTNKLTIFTQGEQSSWSLGFEAALRENGITVRSDRITSLKGDSLIEGIVLMNGTTEPCDGVFIAIGAASSVTFAYKLGLEQKDGFLVIDRDGKTNVEWVWAAGGCTGGNPQIAKSVGEGCNAAISIIKRVKGLTQYLDQT